MKFLNALVVVAVVADGTVAKWLGKSAYNSWHKTELERWLDDHDIPYPSPADRNDLEKIIEENWNNKVSTPYSGWDVSQLQAYLKDRGYQAQDSTKETKDTLLGKVKENWHESENEAHSSYQSVKDWIFDSWTDSQLKAFLDKHGIPAPQPRKRDNLLAAARHNYESAAKKAGETASYPGNWLYHAWSESDLKAWLDERGIPAPQPTTRDRLIATVRRNARLASKQSTGGAEGAASSVSSAAGQASSGASDTVFDAWSDSTIKAWADKNGIKVPQGSNRNELLALARKNKAYLTGDDISGGAASAFGAATSNVGENAAKATDAVKQTAEDAFNAAIGTWSESRLKAYLDARGVPVPQSGKRDEIVAAVRKHQHKAATGYSAWTFDTWTTENLRKWLSGQDSSAAKKAGKKTDATRDELVKQAQDSYASASKSGGSAYASVTSSLAQATDYAKDTTFDAWTSSELKAYLDSYGVPVPQGTKTEELRALARRQSTYFRYGTSSPGGTLLAKFQNGAQWILDQLKLGTAGGRKGSEEAYDRVKEAGASATHQAGEAAQRASDRAKEEL